MTLKVQEYLRTEGKSLETLNAELGVTAVRHETLPLVILNYSHTSSKKTDPIVRECRGLVLNSRDWSLVARSFPRFFNVGEVRDEWERFDFDGCCVQTKEDGSLVLIYNFEGRWMANTRGSFADGPMEPWLHTWHDGICNEMAIGRLSELDGHLDPSVAYICEFCSPWNKIVRNYAEPRLFFLTAFRGEKELHWDALHDDFNFFEPVERWSFEGIDEVRSWLAAKAESDPTFEGVVLRDRNGLRFKCKSHTYLGLHRMKGNDGFSPKNLLPFALSGEADELLSYFPEAAEEFKKVSDKVCMAHNRLAVVWAETWRIESQKDFALAIVKRTPFSSILFQLRKAKGKDQTPEDLRAAWRASGDLILKVLFQEKP